MSISLEKERKRMIEEEDTNTPKKKMTTFKERTEQAERGENTESYEELKSIDEPLAKQILDRWGTGVAPSSAVYLDNKEVARVNSKKMQHYGEVGYSEDLVLWIPPKDCIRMEFEDTPDKNHRYILETESVCKSLEIDYCITSHGGKSDYVNIFNIKNIPMGEENQNAKLLFIDLIIPSKAKDYLDRTNLGWTLSPIIEHPHWKPMWNGAIHKILRGKNPIKHENEYPKELLKLLKKSKAKHKKHIYDTRKSANWVSDFLLGYCCENELPGGARHYVIEKNLAAYIIHRKDKEDIKNKYYATQKRQTDTLRTWETAILNGDYTNVSTGEIVKYIKDYGIEFEIPVEKEKVEEVDGFNFDEASESFMRLSQANNFIKKQPLFYDKAGIFWLWNFEKFCYEMVDDVEVLNKICGKIKIDTTNSKIKSEILNALKQMGRINTPQEMEKQWVQYKNQIVDVKNGETFEATPKYFAVNPIDWKIGESEYTPTMDKLFKEWVVMEGVQDETYVDTLYEELAYATLNDQFLQRLFAYTGSGSNGKGCFLKLLTKFIGDEHTYSTELRMLSGEHNFETASLYKKQICLMGEVDALDLKNSNLLKKLTGEDKIRYEFKGKKAFSDYSSTTCFVATNSLPLTPDKSLAFYRRWLIVDFPHIFKVGKDIIGEIPDIEFENLVKKCIRIGGELYNNKVFTNEGEMDERILKYEDRSNPLKKFIRDECIEEPNADVEFKVFFKAFNKFLMKHRLREYGSIQISRMLKNEGYIVKQTTTTNNGVSKTASRLLEIGLKNIGKNGGVLNDYE